MSRTFQITALFLCIFVLLIACTGEEGALAGGTTGGSGTSGTSGSTGAVSGPLTVVSVTPANGATGVVRDPVITITFSRTVDPATLSTNTVQLHKWWDGYKYPECIAGSFDFTLNPVVRFTPADPLDDDYPFELVLTNGILDADGGVLQTAMHTGFWTSASLSSEYPRVVSSTPTNGAGAVFTGSSILVTFSEKMAQSSLTVSSPAVSGDVVQLYPAGDPSARVTLSRNSLDKTNFILAPQSALSAGVDYILLVKKDAKSWTSSGDGDSMLNDYMISFTTGMGGDPNPLAVTSVDPADGSTGAATDSEIVFVFNKQVDPTSVFLSYPGTAGSIRVSRHADLSFPEEGILTVSNYSGGCTVRFRLGSGTALDASRVYYAGVTGGSSGVRALSGAVMTADYISSFTTEAGVPGTIADIRAASGSCAITVSGVYMTFFRNYPDGYKAFFVQKERDGEAVMVLVSGSVPPFHSTDYIYPDYSNVDLTVTSVGEYNGMKQVTAFTIVENGGAKQDLTWMVQNLVTVVSNQSLGEPYEARLLQIEGFLSNYLPGSSARNRRYDLYYNSGQYVRLLIDQDITDGMGIGNGSRVRVLAPLQQDGDGYFIKPYYYTSTDGVSASDLDISANYPQMLDIVQITNW